MKIFGLIILFLVFSNALSDDYQELRNQSDAVLVTHNHDILKAFAGTYRQIYFFTPPEAKSEKGSGRAENKIIMDERYLEITSTLNFNKDKIQKKIIIGFDGISKKYQLTEYSNMETYPLTATGTYSYEQKSLVFEGRYPYSETNSNTFKMIFKYDSTDSFTYYFIENYKGKEEKILEIRNFKLD
jgi:hypothetical protein